MRRKKMKEEFDEAGIEAVEAGWKAAWERDENKVVWKKSVPKRRPRTLRTQR